jgi:plastocyanin
MIMKKIGLLVLILSLVVMITACSAVATPAPAATVAPEPTATAAPEPAATAVPELAATETETVTEESGAASTEQSEDVQVIDVEMNSTGYVPDEVTVKAGSHIRFNFTNTDDLEHDLFNRQVNIDTGELSSRDTLAYDWVAPETPGSYVAECTLHEGLQLVVVVE